MGWNQQYYDTLSFYFWEPQHIGRRRNPSSRIRNESDVVTRLRSLEVALNHQMELFFRLAPNSFANRFLATAFGAPIYDKYEVAGRELRNQLNDEGMLQPDIVLQGNANVVAIELKVGAKSSLAQLIKYMTFFVTAGRDRAPSMLFMGPGAFADIWPERFQDAGEVWRAAREFDRLLLAPSWRAKYDAQRARIADVIPRTKLAFMSYQTFHDEIAQERLAAGCVHETYSRLLDGMAKELIERKLAKGTQPPLSRPLFPSRQAG